LFLAIMMDSRAYAATLPEIFMGTFEDAYTGGDPYGNKRYVVITDHHIIPKSGNEAHSQTYSC